MKRIVDLSQLSVPQLFEIRRVLAGGVEATAETKKAKELKRLEAENARLKKMQERRDIVESAGLEWDEDYYMHFNDKHFMITVRNISNAMKQTSYAEKKTLRIPQMPRIEELSAIELIQQEFKNRKNGHREVDL